VRKDDLARGARDRRRQRRPASNNRDTMLALTTALDADNNLGCPLN
jgi:hypothetical protein